MNTDEIAKALNLNEITQASVEILDDVVNSYEIDNENDYKLARRNITNIINKGQRVFSETLADIANQAQDPKLFNAMSQMIETLVKANEQLVELSSKKAIREKFEDKVDSLSSNEVIQTENKTINNNLFIGSTAELQTLIQNLSKQI